MVMIKVSKKLDEREIERKREWKTRKTVSEREREKINQREGRRKKENKRE